MRFIGIDLAWKPTHQTGVAVLDGSGEVVDEEIVLEDTELLAVIEQHDVDGAVLAIDAPLVLKPGVRGPGDCERELQKRYGGRHAGPYSSSFDRLGGSRAMNLVDQLKRHYVTTATPPHRSDG